MDGNFKTYKLMTFFFHPFLLFFLFCFAQRGFVKAHPDDGYLEIFGLKQGWHASMVMAEVISAKHIAQVLLYVFQLIHLDYCEKLSVIFRSSFISNRNLDLFRVSEAVVLCNDDLCF